MASAGNLTKRILSALVLAPIAVGAIYLGGTAYLCLILLTVLVAQAEWMRLVAPGAVIWIHVAAFAALILEAVATLFFGFLTGVGVIVGASLLIVSLVRLTRAAGARRIALGVLYIGATMAATLWLRDLPEIGLGLTCFLFGSVWATDMGAYAAGRAIGGPKLAPRLSPNKTWAGLIGGMIAAAVAGFLIAMVFDAGLRFVAAAVASVLAVIAQSGDLFESAMKRRAGVKDSGTLIPGHGGVLDRIDGLMAAAPVLAIWQLAVGDRLGWW
ncbi:MAG: phosphatidate cytidylyltransferase [Pseudomonadota bacterium]